MKPQITVFENEGQRVVRFEDFHLRLVGRDCHQFPRVGTGDRLSADSGTMTTRKACWSTGDGLLEA